MSILAGDDVCPQYLQSHVNLDELKEAENIPQQGSSVLVLGKYPANTVEDHTDTGWKGEEGSVFTRRNSSLKGIDSLKDIFIAATFLPEGNLK
jgi:hypothetical protein